MLLSYALHVAFVMLCLCRHSSSQGSFIDLRRQVLMSRTSWPASEYGVFDLAEWNHLPALPSPSVQVTEVAEMSEQDRIEMERTKVLDLRLQGMGLHAIEKALEVALQQRT